MASSRLNKDFADSLLHSDPLDLAIDYIQDNLDPEDVFEDDALETWALNNGFIKGE